MIDKRCDADIPPSSLFYFFFKGCSSPACCCATIGKLSLTLLIDTLLLCSCNFVSPLRLSSISSSKEAAKQLLHKQQEHYHQDSNNSSSWEAQPNAKLNRSISLSLKKHTDTHRGFFFLNQRSRMQKSQQPFTAAIAMK